MAELVQRRDDDAEPLDRLEVAERQLALACEAVDDPFDLQKLKEAQFAVYEVRTKLSR
jgi:hypothetical protein